MASLERRQALLVDARRKRNLFVESARDGSGGTPVRGGSPTAVGATPPAPAPVSAASSKNSGSGAAVARPDSAVELLVDSGVMASLPSATTFLEFLSEATAAAAASARAAAVGNGNGGGRNGSGGYGDLTLATLPTGVSAWAPNRARLTGRALVARQAECENYAESSLEG